MVDQKLKEKATKKLKDGWIRSLLMIEVLTSSEEVAKKALEDHVRKLEKEKNAIVYNKIYHDIRKVEKPHPSIPVGYSYIVELDMLTQNLETLVYIAMTYAPSSIEIIEPDKLKIDIGEAQSILNSVSDMLHKFAAAGIGGVVINTPEG